jgi:RNA-directed DNA polymerase
VTVLSNDGKSELTKLKRLRGLSAENPFIIFNNIGYIIDKKFLIELYYLLDGNKAVGIDKVTKEEFGKDLESNIERLIIKIRRKVYLSKPARITEIPKDDGSTRPLAISCFEDKLVQIAVSKILTEIFEPIFLPCSFGFRENKNCHDAIKELHRRTFDIKNGAIVEIDIQKYFNSIPHKQMLEFLKGKISDKRFLKLIEILMKTPSSINGKIVQNKIGCPQGSIISPILSNIYLHYVIDNWFKQISISHIQGQCFQIRYADDMVFLFENYNEAERFFKVLPLRLEKYGLSIHLEKSQIIPSGRYAALKSHNQKNRLPIYKFLGFTCYWGLSRNRKFWRLHLKSRSDRICKKLQGMKEFLWKERAGNTRFVLAKVIAILRGWINYHAVSDNQRQVHKFISKSQRILFKWFNKRGGNRHVSWERFKSILKDWNYPNKIRVISLFQN